MSINHEQQYYTGYEGYESSSYGPHSEYSHNEQHAPYTTSSQQPYGQPVQVFVQFTQSQPHPAQPFDGRRIAAVFSYALGWLSRLLFFLFSDGNRYVRFHALQSLLFFGGINAFDILFILSTSYFRIFPFLPFMPYLRDFAVLFFLMVNFIAFVGWLIALFQAARGTYFKLPVVGEIVTHLLRLGPPDMVK